MSTERLDPAAVADALRAGDRAFEAGDFAGAARHYARVVAADGRCAAAWYALGNARWRRGDRAGAIEAYGRAVGEDPGRARAWQNLSTAQLAASRWAEAAEAAGRAVGIDPSRVKAWNNLGVARYALGDRLGAETALRRGIEVDPGFAVAWANLGRLLADTGRPDVSRSAYEKAMALGEAGSEVREGLARVLVSLGDAPRAEALLEGAVKAEPSDAGAWLALGDLRRTRAARGAALEAYEAASAASEEMPADVRARIARRRRHVALELALEALGSADRAEFSRTADRLREASDAASSSGGGVDPSLAPLVERCLAVARAHAEGLAGAEWIHADRVKGVLERALAPKAPSSVAGGVP